MGTISFWGLFLIVIGLSLVIKTIFNLDFSIFRIAIAFVFIFFGVKMFVGKNYNFCKEEPYLTIFGERNNTNVSDSNKYHIVFGAGKFNLKNFKTITNKDIHIEINTVFGGTELILPDSIPVIINSHTIFAGTKLPDGNTSAFGTLSYSSDSTPQVPTIYIKTNTIFGGLIVKK